ncbi:prolipoprotein diacylglyceryl transferase [Porifericola rhodea]|uniref:DUF6787 family protein n=1 Tax=Porifericola rhodea TaxID=930972 RepID=UPI0026669327|nr:DUF6787 family protein [Porifericola rhodea]WKN32891.1 prolipoprotein diacylglyceryl transferase [Porifericola rhodea]
MGWIQNLQSRWEVKSTWQVIVILIVFACTGFTVMFLKQPLYKLAGITEQTSAWIKVPYYMLTVLPVYQLVLLAYGFVFGQFQFFWKFEKRMFKGMAKLFGVRYDSESKSA